MHPNHHLLFLQQKIQDLGSAIFYNLSDAVLKFPTTLVNSPQVDAYGYVWFWMQQPRQRITEFENGFPVRLDFYRKGARSFLQVSGKAWIVTDPEDQLCMPQKALEAGADNYGKVLVKVKMIRADYHETAGTGQHPGWGARLQQVGQWLKQASGSYQSSNTYYPAS